MYQFISVLLYLVHLSHSLLNCTRYQQPCQIEGGLSCCGYPLFDCISDGIDTTCRDIRDFPELETEFALRMREAMDQGQANSTTLDDLRRNVNGLLGVQGQLSNNSSPIRVSSNSSSTAATRRPARMLPRSSQTQAQQQFQQGQQRPQQQTASRSQQQLVRSGARLAAGGTAMTTEQPANAATTTEAPANSARTTEPPTNASTTTTTTESNN